ncbi:rna polymerase ii mediator complex component [Colletotrichum incanum]|uniref:Rna polymerase ii mediator complex component n=1 Tax=Colletotrichum incanum TaxID=1573173 RepID=A0A167A6W1_COLIC|nr:rna polymerase ii mediator complex component [Colletotrichum incanum]
MGRRSKQKACFACAEAKRRCDRTLPSCSRCLDKEFDCVYPVVRPRPFLSSSSPSNSLDPRLSSGWDIPSSWPGSGMAGIALQGPVMDAMDEALFAPSAASGPDTAAATTSSSSSSATNQADTDTASHLSLHAEGLNWFLQSPSWAITYQRSPPTSVPPAAVFTNFVRGLQSWLVRFLHKGHNPFIHRHLYSETTLPHCMQDAYAAIAIAQTVTSDNEHVVDAVSNSFIMNLLAAHSTTDPSFMPLLSTSEHLARTQALLIHLLLSLFSPSISRRAKAESLIDTLRLWARQLWESAAVDATTSPIFPNALSMSCDQALENDEVVPRLYQAFILSESIRRTFLLTSIATGVYTSLKATWSHGCHGDVCITLRGELWEAPSAARWEAVAKKEDPLFLHSLKGQTLLSRGIRAAEVDEYARLIFTVLWGLEKVEHWVVSTGDAVSVTY